MCKKGQILEKVTVEKMVAEGKCLVRHNDQVIFVNGVAPGDQIDLKIIGRKKKYLQGLPQAYHRYSNLRVEPFCSHFGTCGGCKWMHVTYSSQLENKRQQVIDNLCRIGKVEIPEVPPIIASQGTQYYRNKLEFTFSDKRWLSDAEMASGKVCYRLPFYNAILKVGGTNLFDEKHTDMLGGAEIGGMYYVSILVDELFDFR